MRSSTGRYVLLAIASIFPFLVIIFGAFGWLLYFNTGSHILYYPHVRDIECIIAWRTSQCANVARNSLNIVDMLFVPLATANGCMRLTTTYENENSRTVFTAGTSHSFSLLPIIHLTLGALSLTEQLVKTLLSLLTLIDLDLLTRQNRRQSLNPPLSILK